MQLTVSLKSLTVTRGNVSRRRNDGRANTPTVVITTVFSILFTYSISGSVTGTVPFLFRAAFSSGSRSRRRLPDRSVIRTCRFPERFRHAQDAFNGIDAHHGTPPCVTQILHYPAPILRFRSGTASSTPVKRAGTDGLLVYRKVSSRGRQRSL